MEFVELPAFPKRRVKTAVVNFSIPGAIAPFRHLALHDAIAAHADLGLCHLGGNRFVTSADSFEYYKEKLPEAQLICGKTGIKSPYPLDAAYCAAVFGHFAVASERVTDPVLLALLQKDFMFIPVRQGYAKCNLCPIAPEAVITEDEGLYRALSPHMDVLYIRSHGAILPPYAYGFFGGCTGLVDEHTLFVSGRLSDHPEAEKIRAFASKYGVHILQREGVLSDIGSLLPIAY